MRSKVFLLSTYLVCGVLSCQKVERNRAGKVKSVQQISHVMDGIYESPIWLNHSCDKQEWDDLQAKGSIRKGLKFEGSCPNPRESKDFIILKHFDKERLCFHMELSFDNGHSCSVEGLLHRESFRRWSYHDSESACAFEFFYDEDAWRTDEIVTGDEGACERFCGARGSLSGAAFPPKPTRKVSYLRTDKEAMELGIGGDSGGRGDVIKRFLSKDCR